MLVGCAPEPSDGPGGGAESAGTGGSTPLIPGGNGGAAAPAGTGAAPLGGQSSSAGQTSGAGGGGGTPSAAGSGSAGAGATGGLGGASGGAADAGTSEDAGDDGGSSAPDCEGGKVVHFVYFVEADETFSEALRADVEEQAFRFQQFWFDQLGVTFYLNHPVVDVIEAEHDADSYLTTPDGIHDDERWYRLGNVKSEVYDTLGIEDFDDDHRVVNYPTTRHDGHVGGNFGGAWMDGDDLSCIADNGFNYPYDDGNSAHCTGHVAHEFGHVLGLDHQGPNEDCMQFGFYTDDPDDLCSFSEANVAQILGEGDNDGWFEAMPGETCTGL